MILYFIYLFPNRNLFLRVLMVDQRKDRHRDQTVGGPRPLSPRPVHQKDSMDVFFHLYVLRVDTSPLN